MLHVCVALASGIVDLTSSSRIRLTTPSFTANSEEGTVAQSTLLIDDLASSLTTLKGWSRCWAYEDTAPQGDQIIWAGFLGERRTGRKAGGEDEFVVGADRRINAALIEANTLLSARLITGADGNRPAETDLQRIAWMASAGYLPGIATTYVSTTGAVTLDAADLRGQSAYAVLSNCSNHSGRNFFLVLVDGGSPSRGLYSFALFYDDDYAATLTSSQRLSNTRSEIDYTTTFPLNPGAELVTSPSRVYSGVLVRYRGGSTYQQTTQTGNDFLFRDTATDAPNVESLAVAQALGTRYLSDAALEEDRIEGVEISVPNTLVNAIREGDRVQVKASHWENYASAYQYMRVLKRTVTQQSDTVYRISLTLLPLGVLTYSFADIEEPNYTNYPGDGFGGTWRVQFDGDGDSPAMGGCSPRPKVGLVSYLGSSGERTGIRCDGRGLVTIYTHGTLSGVGGGDITFVVTIRINGTVVATTSQSTSGGLRALGWTWDLTLANQTVRSGDVIEVYFTNPAVNILVIPAGVGDCANLTTVTGYLRA